MFSRKRNAGTTDTPLGLDDIDIWAMRDQGYVRAADIPRVEAMVGPEAKGQIVADYDREPSVEQKQAVIAKYEELAAYLNRTRFSGRSDWTARKAWSLGRGAAAKMWGVESEATILPSPWV